MPRFRDQTFVIDWRVLPRGSIHFVGATCIESTDWFERWENDNGRRCSSMHRYLVPGRLLVAAARPTNELCNRGDKVRYGSTSFVGRSDAAHGDQSKEEKCQLGYVIGLMSSTLAGPADPRSGNVVPECGAKGFGAKLSITYFESPRHAPKTNKYLDGKGTVAGHQNRAQNQFRRASGRSTGEAKGGGTYTSVRNATETFSGTGGFIWVFTCQP